MRCGSCGRQWRRVRGPVGEGGDGQSKAGEELAIERLRRRDARFSMRGRCAEHRSPHPAQARQGHARPEGPLTISPPRDADPWRLKRRSPPASCSRALESRERGRGQFAV
eukprot:scaffold3942_cov123-Isochrysis_galbana.AAC.3